MKSLAVSAHHEVKSERVMRVKVKLPVAGYDTVTYFLKECPKCNGDMVDEKEIMGIEIERTKKCLNCGLRF